MKPVRSATSLKALKTLALSMPGSEEETKETKVSRIAFKTVALKTALKSYGKKVATNLKTSTAPNTVILLNEENKDLLEFLSEKITLTNSQKVRLSGFLFAGKDLGEVKASSVNEFYNKLAFLTEKMEPVLEVNINNKWYPLLAALQKYKTFGGGWICQMNVYGMLGAMQYSKPFNIGEWDFENRAGERTAKTINEVLSKVGVRVASKESIEHCRLLNKKLPAYKTYVGQVFDSTGTGLTFHNYWGWNEINVGHKDAPVSVIIEPNLENQYAQHEIHNGEAWQLPFVRVFSLKHKDYVFVDIEELETHTFHPEDKSKIVLPPNMMTALESVFNVDKGNIFGDLFNGRHGGIVVLANGPSGVGKTLTAEVFAEFQKRPLYAMEMSEIGTSLKEVEANLQKIFARAKKWNAVLLFDEADIFLSERAASELERSAIVGIFLRLLDYYEGTFFLTTNRGEGIDKAFKSRVTLYLNYPELSSETRLTIWQSMLAAAGLAVLAKSEITWEMISKENLNGRQIRNQVRLLRLMYPGGTLTTADVMDSLAFTAR